jgi:HK97 family phage major capsid protein
LAEYYINYIANLMAADYNPNAIITTAANWGVVLNTKPNNYSIPGAVQITADGTVMIAGVPLLAQNNMAAGKSLIGDFTKAAIIQTEGLSVNFYEQDSDNVQRNLITARVEARVGLAILRPDAFIYN